MDRFQLLSEGITCTEGNIITEAMTDGKKDVFLSGVFMQAEIENRNKRRYPLSEMTNAVAQMNAQIKEYGGVFGELDHPADRLNIALDRISHVITELYMDGNNAIGKAKLLDTPMGLIAKELARSGTRYGVSSRGAGQVNEGGLVSSFKCVTIDLVATPSAQGAMPNTVYEGVMDYKEGRIMTLAEAAKHDPLAQKYLQDEILKCVRGWLKK